MNNRARVIGGGLAGVEAAWQLAQRGIEVELYEMRPGHPTPAHHTDFLAELVCSNSLGAFGEGTAAGLLKAEMRMLGSVVLRAADETSVPAGGALAVDRDRFAERITGAIAVHPLIHLIRSEVTELAPDIPTVLASGPLTSPALSAALSRLTGREHLHFYDAAAPILTLESLDMERTFKAARYNKGEGVYINCPLTKEEYEAFWHELVNAEGTVLHLAEEKQFFEGCLAVEVLARRGIHTLRYGPMKPVGLDDPRTGRWPYAVVQLRQDTCAGDLYNMVGFQTQLKWGEQKRVFRMIPGLENAEFVRLGVMHRNTYLESPLFLDDTLQWRAHPLMFAAGCLIGVEGYAESAASGIIAGLNLARTLHGEPPLTFPVTTMLGSLLHYVSHAEAKHFQPMNANWGIIAPIDVPKKKDKIAKRALLRERALDDFTKTLEPTSSCP